MARIVPAADCRPEPILAQTVAVVGYGNQGRAHAANLRESGATVVVGAREGRSRDQALADGFRVLSVSDAVAAAGVVMLTLPDGPMPAIVREHVLPVARPGQTFLLAHGFNVVFDQVAFPAETDVAMVSPKGAGYGVRAAYEAGGGVPALVAVHQNPSGNALALALSYAWALGCARSLVLETSFREETVTDLFGEQTVLCGGIPDLIRAAFHTLVARGYSPEIAYFECLHETKLIVDLIVAKGIAGMREAISDTAAWGGLSVGPQVVDSHVRQKLETALDAIESGSFAADWVAEQAASLPRYRAFAEKESADSVEEVGARLRAQMRPNQTP